MAKIVKKEKVEVTLKKAEKALRELIASGEKINQHAVEKKAGLSNGTLNYNVQEYKDLKLRITKAKSAVAEAAPDKIIGRGKLQDQKRLKEKYRTERDNLREECKKLKGEKLELITHLLEMQRYIKHLEKKGVADSKLVQFKPSNSPSSRKV